MFKTIRLQNHEHLVNQQIMFKTISLQNLEHLINQQNRVQDNKRW